MSDRELAKATKPKPDPARDDLLHAIIRRAYNKREVLLHLDPVRLNRHDSPVHSPWDRLLPLLISTLAALLVLLFHGLALGLAAMAAAVAFQLLALEPLSRTLLRRRAIDALLHNPYNWELLWKYGGVAMVLRASHEVNVVAPRDDWRVFVQRYLDHPAPEASP